MTQRPGSSSSEPKVITEGRAKIILPSGGALRKARPFYNPRMSLNRDLAILFLSAYFPASRHSRICDPMTGSGVRAVRYVLEAPNVSSVLAADVDPEAVEAAMLTVRRNRLEEKIRVIASDANLLLLNHSLEQFDLIDLDPFGSPAPFFESTLRATINGGVVAATATDMAPLTGARKQACLRKYGACAIRTEFEKEMAVRILAGCLARIAAMLQLGASVVFSYAFDHYVRIQVAIAKGRAAANASIKSLGFLEYCPICLRRDSRKALDSFRMTCEDCGSKTEASGPIWLGELWGGRMAHDMLERTPALECSRLPEVQGLLMRIEDETKAPPFHYRTDALARTLKIKPPGRDAILQALRDEGYRASRTHFSPIGFRTDASSREIGSVMKSLPQKP